MIKSRNADVEAVAVSAVEGKPVYGGNMLVKPLIKGDEMTFLEIHYAAGVGAPLHTHTHESIAYVVKGKVKSTVGSDEFIMGSGDVCRHPKGVLHGLEAIEDSVVVEIKSPAPEISALWRRVMRLAISTASEAPVEPSYIEALATSMPVSMVTWVWNSKRYCSVPCAISG